MVLELSQCGKFQEVGCFRRLSWEFWSIFTSFSLRIVQCGPTVEQTATPRKILCWPISLGSYKLGVFHDHRALLGPHLCGLVELGQSTVELVKNKTKVLGSSLLSLFLDECKDSEQSLSLYPEAENQRLMRNTNE